MDYPAIRPRRANDQTQLQEYAAGELTREKPGRL